MTGAHRVVVVGGGFGGLYAAQSLKRAAVDITLVDRRNFHLFQPLLYQVATGGLSPANIAAPLRSILKRQRNARVLLAEATGLDAARRVVSLADGEVPYDSLIVAAGMANQYFGHDQWAPLAPGLKTIEDATEIRRRILTAFEQAERRGAAPDVAEWLTFVVIGGGPTGVELAGALAEIARDTLRREFRTINPAAAKIVLVDAADRILQSYPPELSEKAAESLRRLGVTVYCGVRVTQIAADAVELQRGGGSERVAARTVLWAAGVQASPLGRIVASATGTQTDRLGRVIVAPDLSIAGHPDVFVIGDLANFPHQGGQPLPGVAQVAMQQGRYVARLIEARLRGRTLPPFRYKDLGNMATIGRAAAVAQIGSMQFSGYLAWLLWLFVHLIHIVEFQNRVLVLLQWAWNYITFNRAARLITGDAERASTAGSSTT